jgi:hypothetical protein
MQVDIKPPNVDVISPKPIAITPGQFDASGCLIIDDDTEVDDEAWNKKQEECSFCKSFLQSPCRDPFKKWSKCVEKSKELDIEFVKACRIYTDSLLQCSSENADYFGKLEAALDKEEDDKAETGMYMYIYIYLCM